MPFVGQWELILLGAVLLLIFGSSQLPRIGRQLGRGAREYQKTVAEIDPRRQLKELEAAPEDKAATTEPPKPPV